MYPCLNFLTRPSLPALLVTIHLRDTTIGLPAMIIRLLLVDYTVHAVNIDITKGAFPASGVLVNNILIEL